MKAEAKQLIKEAVVQNPKTGAKGWLERSFTWWFSGWVYNQIWEDPRVDLEALSLDEDSRVLTIGSGGCNILNYLVQKPRSIEAVDLNASHMQLVRLKLAALAHLPSYEDFFLFFAKADDKKNLENYYRYIKPHLSREAQEYWEGGSWFRKAFRRPRIEYFTRNLYNYSRSGYFIRFLHTFAKTVKCDPSKVLTAKTMEEQDQLFRQFIQPGLNHWFVKILGRAPIAVYSLGIPPQQFQAMKAETSANGNGVVSLFTERVRRLACDFPVEDNYFAWQAFARKYNVDNPGSLPDYLKRDNYELLKENLHRVTTSLSSLHEYLAAQEDDRYDGIVLLDSQDWMSGERIRELWSEIARVTKPDAKIIFRTAAPPSPVEEALHSPLKEQFSYEVERSKELYDRDRSAVYGGFHVYSRAVNQ